mgnify:CR=1 FL=1
MLPNLSHLQPARRPEPAPTAPSANTNIYTHSREQTIAAIERLVADVVHTTHSPYVFQHGADNRLAHLERYLSNQFDFDRQPDDQAGRLARILEFLNNTPPFDNTVWPTVALERENYARHKYWYQHDRDRIEFGSSSTLVTADNPRAHHSRSASSFL